MRFSSGLVGWRETALDRPPFRRAVVGIAIAPLALATMIAMTPVALFRFLGRSFVRRLDLEEQREIGVARGLAVTKNSASGAAILADTGATEGSNRPERAASPAPSPRGAVGAVQYGLWTWPSILMPGPRGHS